MTQSLGRYLLTIEPIPSTASSKTSSQNAFPLPAYFVGSTAPNNVEDGVSLVPNPEPTIRKIARFLKAQENPEILIAVHGYNIALGEFATEQESRKQGTGVKGWYQDIRNHIAEHCPNCSNGLVMIGYRWPSEQVKGIGNDTLGSKFSYARQSLPIALKVISILAIAVLVGLSIVAWVPDLSSQISFTVIGISLLTLATIAISIVFTLFILRIAGYFRDSYRANNFGVPDLIEFIRQLDKEILGDDDPAVWSNHRIKLSFIGHSMGEFVVTNAVRILSDVFDRRSIDSISMGTASTKHPSAYIGSVFSLGRLVLASPDIPAETIVSGRANFLSSSLRRFEETYLFSNEGDMALKLASTAANYSSFPSRTREGGYRLGNVVVRSPLPWPYGSKGKGPSEYGIVNLDLETGQLLDVQPQGPNMGVEPKKMKVPQARGNDPLNEVEVSSYLKYLYVLDSTSLIDRQKGILDTEQRPIAELFTVFDCTDYCEEVKSDQPEGSSHKVGLLSHALRKPSLKFWDYLWLTVDYFSGKIDTHGGYFYSAPPDDSAQRSRPEATFSKQLIYGLACLGFKALLLNNGEASGDERAIALKEFSNQCQDHGIQVLLAAERYNQDVLGIPTERNGY